jgi:macrolide transport system ATP-binding/permease protein
VRALRRLVKRLTSFVTSGRDEARLREEIEAHLAMQTADNIRAGLSPDEARRQAALTFGGVEATKERYREQRGVPSLTRLLQDTRHAIRRLRQAPTFTIATILTLALGIGATTAIFTLVHAVLLQSLPVPHPEALYRLGRESRCCYVGGYSQDQGFSLVSYDLYTYLRDHTQGFADLAAFPAGPMQIAVRRAGGSEGVQVYPGEFVSGNYFAMLAIAPAAGRLLTPADDMPGAPPVAVMSDRLWRQRYGADPTVIGAAFTINDTPVTIIGITPPGFFGDTLRNAPPDVFLPLNTEPLVQSDTDLRKYATHWLALIGRIQPGVAPASLEAGMRAALKQWLQAHWNDMNARERAALPEQTLFLSPGGAGIPSLRDQYQQWLLILMAVTGFVLLIVCANVANLMLVRAVERRQQVSLSMALGAGLSHVVRQPLIESLLLSLAGGLAGLAVAVAGTRGLLSFVFPAMPGAGGAVPIDASPSMPVLLFAFITSCAAGLAFGIAPAWMAARVDPIEALRGSSRSSTRAGSRPRQLLVVLQAALSLVLLSSAGLLTSALRHLEQQPLGFEPDRRLVASMNLRLAGYRAAQLPAFYARLHDAIAGIPGVSSVALCLYAPPRVQWGTGVWVDGRPAPGPRDDIASAWDRVTPDYFDVLGTPIVKGRAISPRDTTSSPKVAVVSESFARKFFGSEDPIGKHFGRTPGDSREVEIIGVARDARYFAGGPDQPALPIFFLPEAQADYTHTTLGSLFLRDIVILTRPGVTVPATAIHQAVSAVDPGIPLTVIRTLREQVSSEYSQPRLIAYLTSFFGLLSLVLASIGQYGVTADNVGRRTSEIGIRMALGAQRLDVIRLVLRGTLGVLMTGLAIGLPLTFTAGKLLGHQLYGTAPLNPAVTTIAILALAASTLIASILPALRAILISPVDALRME